jgi:hypothetical protein
MEIWRFIFCVSKLCSIHGITLCILYVYILQTTYKFPSPAFRTLLVIEVMTCDGKSLSLEMSVLR